MHISSEQIETYIAAVEASGVLGRSKRRARLLRYLLEVEHRGDGETLKGYAIGLDVLDRGSDFDASEDSIVRVEVGRLRDALALFRTMPDARGILQVDIPKGGYRPVIKPPREPEIRNEAGEPQQNAPQRAAPRQNAARLIVAAGVALIAAIGAFSLWSVTETSDRGEEPPFGITVAVRDAISDVNDPQTARFLNQYVTGLRAGLARNRSVRVLSEADAEASVLIRVNVQGLEQPEMMILDLIDGADGTLRFARSFDLENGITDEALQRVLSESVRDLYPWIVTSSKDNLSRRDPETLNAWELYLLSTWVPGRAISTLDWEVERRDFARRALALDPDLGQAHSVLADKLVYLASVDAAFDAPEVIAQARQHAESAVRLAPYDVGVLFNVGIHNWHIGEQDAGTLMMRRVLEIDPDNGLATFLAEIFPYACRPAPDEIVEMATAFDDALEADNPVRWVTLTGLGMLHLNAGALDLAADAEQRAATIFATPDSVMRRAVILHGLGRSEEANQLVASLTADWPGIDPAHYANVTIPRRCANDPEAGSLLARYEAFAAGR